MTRRDYIALAEALQASLAKHPNPEGAMALYTAAKAISAVLKAQNSAFKEPLFLAACGFKETSGDAARNGVAIRGAS